MNNIVSRYIKASRQNNASVLLVGVVSKFNNSFNNRSFHSIMSTQSTVGAIATTIVIPVTYNSNDSNYLSNSIFQNFPPSLSPRVVLEMKLLLVLVSQSDKSVLFPVVTKFNTWVIELDWKY